MIIQDNRNTLDRLCRIDFAALTILLTIFLLQPLEGRTENASPGERKILVSLTANEPAAQKKSSSVLAQKIEGEELRSLLHQLPPIQEKRNQFSSFQQATISMPRPAASIEIPEFKVTTINRPLESCATQFLPPLQVDRFTPSGKLNDRNHASVLVHFNQDMVALTSVNKNNSFVPIKITPELPGQWHWSDTKTLSFVPDSDAWPGSTSFTLKVPSGVTSLVGAAIQSEFKGEFSTPRLGMNFLQSGQHRKGKPPLVMITFDQQIEPVEILQYLKAEIVKENNRKEPVGLELAQPDDFCGDSYIKNSVAHGIGKVIVLKCSKSPPPGQDIAIVLKAGAHSKEGPDKTEQDQTQTVTPVQKFRVTNWAPFNSYDKRSRSSGFLIELSHDIEDDAEINRFVHVSPKDPDSNAKAVGRIIQISGLRGDKIYSVSMSGKIRSSDGQSLGKNFRTSTKSMHFERNYNISSEDLELHCRNNFLIAPSERLITTVFSDGFDKLKVSAYTLDISDFTQFVSSVGIRNEYEKSDSNKILDFLEGKELIKTCQISTDESGPNCRITKVDLSPFLGKKRDRILLLFEGKALGKVMRYCQWVELGNIALNCWANNKEVSVLCSDARTGAPMKDADLSVISKSNVVSIGRTDKDGSAKLSLPDELDSESILVAKTNDHSVILPKLGIQTQKQWFEWYVMHDRGVYRPGETLYYKGWIRQLDDKIDADFQPPDQAHKAIIAVARDSTGTELYRERRRINEYGGFDGAFIIPKTADLGYIHVSLEIEGTKESKQFAVNLQEFRRPEFKVRVTRLNENEPMFGEPIHFQSEANYYSSGAANNAACTWTVDTNRTYFSPAGWPDFSFACADSFGEQNNTELSTKTDATGKSMATVVLNGEYGGPVLLNIRSAIMDMNRQSQEEGTRVTVHSCSYYAGIKGECRNDRENDTLEFCGQLIVTDPKGKARDSKIVKLSLYQKDEEEKNPRRAVETKTVTSSTKPSDFNFKIESGKQYSIIAEITDDKQRIQRTIYRFEARPPEKSEFLNAVRSEDANLEYLNLSSDREEYQPGETALINISSRIADGFGLATIEQPGKISTIPFHVQQHTAVLKIPVGPSKAGLQLDALVLGKLEKTAFSEMNALTPEFAFCDRGSIRIKVNPNLRRLNIDLHPDAKTKRPGDACLITAQVHGIDGDQLSNCEVALFVVDEAALALSDYRPSNPAEHFVNPPQFNVATNSQDYVSTNVFLTAALQQLKGQLEGQEEKAQSVRTSTAIRTNFVPTAVFKASLTTDQDGKVQTSFNLPDNISKYRIFAIAASRKAEFGITESEITTQLPLVLRPSPPRSLNLTDRFELPVIVQNATDKDETISVVARGTFADLRNGRGQKIIVPARDRIEVKFPCTADQIGTAQFQAIARSKQHSDAAQVSIPVLLPNSKETFATYGSLSESETLAQKIELPAEAMHDYGGLDLSASSSQFQELNDASNYMHNYPFDCSEQLAARIITFATLRDLNSSLNAANTAKYSIENDLATLARRQNNDGSFSLWQRGEKSYPYVSIFVTHALVVARNCGYAVPDSLIDQASKYLKKIEPSENRILSANLCAYALYVRSLLNEDVASSVASLSAEANSLSAEGLAWLLHAISSKNHDQLRKDLKSRLFNHLYETASTAGLKSSDSIYGYNRFSLFYSDARADALLLDTLVDADPSNYIIPKIVKSLLLKRASGHWLNTQENAFASLALAHYFGKFESDVPNFSLRAWLGDDYILGKKFAGRSLLTERVIMPMERLKSYSNPSTLTLQKNGSGRLYYRIALNYTPNNPMVREQNNGFEVKRIYESVNSADNARCDTNGIWHVKAGAMIRVRLNVRVDGARFHTALVDHLPAGFEIVNKELRGTVLVKHSKSSDEYWFEHENLRDDRVEIFASQLQPGNYTYSYFVRATTQGRFVAPPAKAEEMYNPETHGRCSTSTVMVE